MPSSSSSSKTPQQLTVVVSSVELTTIETDTDAVDKVFEKLASDFGVSVPQLFLSGCIKVYRGPEVPIKIREASVTPQLG